MQVATRWSSRSPISNEKPVCHFYPSKTAITPHASERSEFARPSGLGLALGLAAAFALTGCGHLHHVPSDKYVYVTAKDTFLRDRVAPVSNRTGEATNGEKLVVLERTPRFLKVRTPDGKVGWIEERLTADQQVADDFEALRQKHLKDPVVASATARDDVYMHVAPGRDTDHFFRLGEGDKLSLLARAAVAKQATAGGPVRLKRDNGPATDAGKAADAAAENPGPPAPVMEDWWLCRDAHGDTGWVYGGLIDVDAPEALVRYSEGQRIVGAYLLAHVDDPDSGMLENGQTVTSIPEYVTVLAPYKSGLPYDFNQVRVFTWNTKKHRYETAFREHNVYGYLPVLLSESADPYGHNPEAVEKLPTFRYNVLAAGAAIPVTDPATGALGKANTITKTYRLEGNICVRVLPPGMPPPDEAHPDVDNKGDKKGAKKRRR